MPVVVDPNDVEMIDTPAPAQPSGRSVITDMNDVEPISEPAEAAETRPRPVVASGLEINHSKSTPAPPMAPDLDPWEEAKRTALRASAGIGRRVSAALAGAENLFWKGTNLAKDVGHRALGTVYPPMRPDPTFAAPRIGPDKSVYESSAEAFGEAENNPALAPSESVQRASFKDPTWRWFAVNIGSMIPDVALQVGAAMASGGSSVAHQALSFAGPQALMTYGDAFIDQKTAYRKMGLDEAEASAKAQTDALLIASVTMELEKFGGREFLKRIAGSPQKLKAAILKRTAEGVASVGKEAFEEGTTEVAQEVAQDFVKWAERTDPNAFADIATRYPATFLFAATMGAGMRMTGELVGPPSELAPAPAQSDQSNPGVQPGLDAGQPLASPDPAAQTAPLAPAEPVQPGQGVVVGAQPVIVDPADVEPITEDVAPQPEPEILPAEDFEPVEPDIIPDVGKMVEPTSPETPDNSNPPGIPDSSVEPTEIDAPSQWFPTDQIGVDPARFQFKEDTDDAGVKDDDRLEGGYDPVGTGALLLWQDKEGKNWVVNGHHRLDLAKRTGTAQVPVQVIREADGISDKAARAMGALINIRDGTGKVKDYAKFVRDSGISEDQAKQKGLLARAKGRTGFVLGSLASDETYEAYINDAITEDRAAAIASAAPRNGRLQIAGLDFAGRNPKATAPEIKAFLQALSTSGGRKKANIEAGDLFGMDDSAIVEAEALAKAAGSAIRDVREDIAAVSGASKRPERAKKMGVDVNDPVAVTAKATALKRRAERLENWHMHPDLVAELRRNAGLDVIEGPAPKIGQDEIVRGPETKPASREPEPGGKPGAQVDGGNDAPLGQAVTSGQRTVGRITHGNDEYSVVVARVGAGLSNGFEVRLKKKGETGSMLLFNKHQFGESDSLRKLEERVKGKLAAGAVATFDWSESKPSAFKAITEQQVARDLKNAGVSAKSIKTAEDGTITVRLSRPAADAQAFADIYEGYRGRGEVTHDLTTTYIKPIQSPHAPTAAKSATVEPVAKSAAGEKAKAPKKTLRQALKEEADASKAYLKKNGVKVSMLGTGSVEDIRHYAIIGAHHIVEGAFKFADYSAKMVETFGEEIRPRLKSLYEASKALVRVHAEDHGESLPDGFDDAGDGGGKGPETPQTKPEPPDNSHILFAPRKSFTDPLYDKLELNRVDSPEDASFREHVERVKAEKLDEEFAADLVQRANEAPFAMTPLQTAAVSVRAAKEIDARDAAVKKLGDKNLDEVSKAFAHAELARTRAAIGEIITALKFSGTEKGRSLASHALALNHDLDLDVMMAEAKYEKNRGRSAEKWQELTAKEKAEIESVVKENEVLKAELAKEKERADRAEAEASVKKAAEEASAKKQRKPKESTEEKAARRKKNMDAEFKQKVEADLKAGLENFREMLRHCRSDS